MENKVLATVNGREITENDIQESIKRFPKEQQAYLATEQGKKQLLEQLISFEVFYNYGKEMEYDKTKEYTTAIEIMERDALTQLSVNKVLSQVELTDKEVEDYYNANKSNFVVGEMISAKHILVDTEELAKEVAEEIKNGMTFGDAATKYSTCPSKAQGGNLGKFGKGQMVPEFEEAAFNLEIGKVSEPVKTQFGYHLIQVEEKQEATEKSFDEVKDLIRTNLLQERQKVKYATTVEELKKKYNVEVK
ncbi:MULTISPECIES: peptidylprolyl isomerase [Clostridium]|uniref:Peptidil-prolyl cis-trans isomerase n=1 Tax=Clostridium novyi (strain NT) TaxID=386415 RepID=A0Q3N8_CLONN|nr:MULTISPECIES: peptidylprolyl isomerase [Clostridium]ABK62643.1 peptidil-prolyl cis-trans isomerase [Clostridium novyi NT]KEH84781.1 peptidylprolyl isomerase [Clostridium novyi A str. NCTC 538]KEH84817.1 peptidylprolyl isomerase [Clostridium novyi A str. 4540]KEH84857.1 peptidylprolyl isomerase [Clostridium novyi A str. BKT29909]KEH89781.1 peptidylprolyl isomerase [Clostridium novyi A str. GD211209]